jgi:hypothetical protein
MRDDKYGVVVLEEEEKPPEEPNYDDPLLGEVMPEADKYADPTIDDALEVANRTKHIFKDPRTGSIHNWENNYMGQTTPIKNWNPLGEDQLRRVLYSATHTHTLTQETSLQARNIVLHLAFFPINVQ